MPVVIRVLFEKSGQSSGYGVTTVDIFSMISDAAKSVLSEMTAKSNELKVKEVLVTILILSILISFFL